MWLVKASASQTNERTTVARLWQTVGPRTTSTRQAKCGRSQVTQSNTRPCVRIIQEVMTPSLEKWTVLWNITQESPLKWENLTTAADCGQWLNRTIYSRRQRCQEMTWAWVQASSQYLFACDTQRLSDTLEVRQPSTERRWKQNPFCNLTAVLPRFLVLDVWQRRVLKETLRLHLKWWLWRCRLLAYRSKHVVEATITTEGFAPRVYA